MLLFGLACMGLLVYSCHIGKGMLKPGAAGRGLPNTTKESDV